MIEQKCVATIVERVWGPGDTYLVVPESQVDSGSFRAGDEVEVIIRKKRGT